MAVAWTTQRLHRFFQQVSEASSHAMMLGGNSTPTALNRWVMMGLHARQILELRGDSLSINGNVVKLKPQSSETNATDRLFDALEQARQAAIRWPEEQARHGLPMAGGLAGCFGYGFYRWCDSGWQKEGVTASASEWPELILCEFEDWLFFDLEKQALVILSESEQRKGMYRALWQIIGADETLDAKAINMSMNEGLNAEQMANYLAGFDVSFTPDRFEQAVEGLKQDIYQGEIYQANLSMRLQKAVRMEPYGLYEQLCLRNPSPFCGFFKWPEGIVVSNSPERLVQMGDHGVAQTRPIAGTRGRGQTPGDDERIGQSLLENEKERAEHLMLVDLARNDLGRVCEPGSVVVDDLLTLERYSHVTHLVSNVRGKLSPSQNGWDLIRALFPGGTITGCPKIRCVEILDRVEPVPRGFYTGSMGFLDAASPALDLNILIRSLFLKPTAEAMVYNTAVHVGAGIVHDAVGTHEYRECLRKANAILNALARLEGVAPDGCVKPDSEALPS